MTDHQHTQHFSKMRQIIQCLNNILLGKELQIKLALSCLLAKGHLLIEDLPGMGKTTLAHGLAKVLGLEFQRVQFTSDLLPSDIIGVSIFNPQANAFEFRQGPLFTQILLADEINRTSPKTQSALLEAMAENQVTVDGVSHALPQPFFVIATQNTHQQSGTFVLPESQLDRFMMRISLGYPDPQSERLLLAGNQPQSALQQLKPLYNHTEFSELQQAVDTVNVNDNLLDYCQRLIAYTRESGDFTYGLSPRAALSWLQNAKAWALLSNRNYVLPEDLQAIMVFVTGHRLLPSASLIECRSQVEKMLTTVPLVV